MASNISSGNLIPSQSNSPGTPPVRVLIVDDSPLIGEILKAMLGSEVGLEVIGQAANGQDAVRKTIRLKPDVITMDIRMPKGEGLEAIRSIMSIRPTPIVVVSNAVYATDYNVAFYAIEAGALTVIEKPRGLLSNDYEKVRAQLVSTIKAMSKVRLVKRASRRDGAGPMTAMLQSAFSHPIQLIAIASSTGGPPVLMQIFSELPKDFSIPIVVVQHILPSFVDCMIEWLNTKSNLPVSIAEEGSKLTPGKVFVAPGDTHLMVTSTGMIRLDASEPVKGQRPSATRMFESVAKAYFANAMGLILTGMGEDGVDGLEILSKAGAHIVAQDETSSVVYGMPQAAVRRGIVDEVLSPDDIVSRLIKVHRHQQSKTRL